MALHQLVVTAERVLQTVFLAHPPIMRAAAAGELMLGLQIVRAALEAAVMAAHKMAHKQLLEQPTRAEAVVAMEHQMFMALLAAPALSSCPTPFQKAQPLNSCLLRLGKHQQASPPLITWW